MPGTNVARHPDGVRWVSPMGSAGRVPDRHESGCGRVQQRTHVPAQDAAPRPTAWLATSGHGTPIRRPLSQHPGLPARRAPGALPRAHQEPEGAILGLRLAPWSPQRSWRTRPRPAFGALPRKAPGNHGVQEVPMGPGCSTRNQTPGGVPGAPARPQEDSRSRLSSEHPLSLPEAQQTLFRSAIRPVDNSWGAAGKPAQSWGSSSMFSPVRRAPLQPVDPASGKLSTSAAVLHAHSRFSPAAKRLLPTPRCFHHLDLRSHPRGLSTEHVGLC